MGSWRKAEGRRQKAEGRRQKAEGRRQKAEGRNILLPVELGKFREAAPPWGEGGSLPAFSSTEARRVRGHLKRERRSRSADPSYFDSCFASFIPRTGYASELPFPLQAAN